MDDDVTVALAVAARVGRSFARSRPWVDFDDAVGEANLAALEELRGYDPGSWRGTLAAFIGQRVNWRLIDWLRREQTFVVRRTVRDDDGIIGHETVLVPWRPENSSSTRSSTEGEDGKLEANPDEPGADDPGYDLVDALDLARRRPPEIRALAPGELGVLRATARGLTSEQVTAERGVSLDTVKSQKKTIIAKLRGRNATNAVAIGFARGILTSSDLEEAA